MLASATATALTEDKPGQRTLLELSLPQIHEHVKLARAVDDRGIGIAVAVEISPGKTAHAGDSGKGMNGQERAVAIISQDRRRAVFCAEHDIEISVSFNVHRPRAGIAAIGYRFGQLGLCGYIGESSRAILSQQAHAAGAGQHQIGLEVVVEINWDDAFGHRRNAGSSARKGNRGASRQMHLAGIGHGHCGRAPTAQRNRSNPIP